MAKATPTPTGSERAARYQPGALSFAASVTGGYLRAGLASERALYLRGPLGLGQRLGGEPARRRLLALPGCPCVELRSRYDVDELAHGRVREHAALGAEQDGAGTEV